MEAPGCDDTGRESQEVKELRYYNSQSPALHHNPLSLPRRVLGLEVHGLFTQVGERGLRKHEEGKQLCEE